MLKSILGLLPWILRLVVEWKERSLANAKKKYANWRAGDELRREKRKARADLVNSVDDIKLRTHKD